MAERCNTTPRGPGMLRNSRIGGGIGCGAVMELILESMLMVDLMEIGRVGGEE